MTSDVLIGLRRLRRRWPGVLVAWGLTSIGIAVFVALAVVADAILVKEPFPGADQLVVLGRPASSQDSRREPRTYLLLDDVARARTESGLPLTAVGNTQRLGFSPDAPLHTPVSTDFFDVIGVRPMLGRALGASDDGATDRAVISESLWRVAFGNDPDIVGRGVTLGDRRLTVVGVLPAGFGFPADTSIWTPLDRTTHLPLTYRAVARLPESIRAEALAHRMPEWHVQRLRDYLYPSDAGHALVFLGAGALLLLTVWTHIVLMQAGDAVQRLGEFRLRLALGASMARVTLSALADAYVSVGVSVALGAMLAPAMLAWLVSQLPAPLLAARFVAIDVRAGIVLVGVLGVGVLAVTLATLSIVAATPGSGPAGTPGGARTSRGLARSARWIVVFQFATATPVLYLLGLAAYSFDALVRTDLGYRVENVLAVRIPAQPDIRAPGAIADGIRKWQALVETVQAQPGVEFAAISADRLGYDPGSSPVSVWLPDGGTGEAVRAERGTVSGAYFDLLRVPLVSGRVFESRSVHAWSPSQGPGEVVIDATLARTLGRGRDLVGRDVVIGGIPTRVIGVVGAMRSRRPDQAPRPRFFLDASAFPVASNLLVRFAGGADAVRRAVSRVVQEEYQLPAPASAVLLTDELTRLQADYRGRYQLLSLTGWISAALTAAGVFGIAAYTVARRRRELAVRMAVGASRRQMLWVGLRDLAASAVVGISAGVTVGLLLGRLVASSLYAVTPSDPFVLASLLSVLAFVGLAGAGLPIRDAWRTDVAAVLRQD